MSKKPVRLGWRIKKRIKMVKKLWQGIAEDYARLVIPNRPSFSDCENYGKLIKQALKNKKSPKILVMGSTPEIRSLLYTYTVLQGASVFCIDINPAMYQAMTNFIAKADLKEKFKSKNWLNNGFPNNFFDLVIGDEIICNIHKNEHCNLFQETARVLKDKNYFITRHNMFLPDKRQPQEIILKVVGDIAQKKYSFQTAINYLYITLFYNKVQRTLENKVNINEELEDIKNTYQKTKNKKYKKILKILIEVFYKNWDYAMDYYWYVLSKNESEEELKQFFTIKKILYAKDYLTTKFSPIYLLNKK